MIKNAIPYFEGIKQRQLLLPWCKSCGKPHFYPRTACPHCWGGDYDWQPAAGTGTIHTYTIVRANPPRQFESILPYFIAIIDLDEGVRIMSNVVGDIEGLNIRDKVKVDFLDRDGETIPVFHRVL